MTARLDWYGCASFRLSLRDLADFLDDHIDRVPWSSGTGLTSGTVKT